MADDSAEQPLEATLIDLENQGLADRRSELTGQRFLSLIHDQDSDRAYVLQHGTDETDGAEIPPGTEVWEYDTFDQAERAYGQLLREAAAAGELVEQDSDEELGDVETDGAEVNDTYSDSDDDDLVVDPKERDGSKDDIDTLGPPTELR